jgi:hypothetical protein
MEAICSLFDSEEVTTLDELLRGQGELIEES